MRAFAEMFAHSGAVTLKAAAGQNDRIGGNRFPLAVVFDNQAGDAPAVALERLRRATVAKNHAGRFGGGVSCLMTAAPPPTG